MKLRCESRPHGYTLIEVLVAFSVFAVVATLGYRGLAHALETKDRIDGEREFWSQISLAFSRIERDLSEARECGSRGNDGKTVPAFAGRTTNGESEMEFTRAISPTFDDRGLQRVRYECSNGALWRLTWSSVDRAPSSQPTRSKVLSDVGMFSAEFLDKSGSAHSTWPLNPSVSTLPRGVRITISVPGRGAFSRAIYIHG